MDISFRTIRIGSKSYEVPLFMDKGQADAITEIIENFEQSVGIKDFDTSFIFDIFADSKIAKGLSFVLTKYFYDLKGLESADLGSYQFRFKLFDLMERENISWASYRQQKQLIVTLAESQGLTPADLELYLFSDYSDNFKVVRRTNIKPEVTLVISYYNTEILKFLFSKSYMIKFTLPDYISKGFFIKNLIRNCKFLGLNLDLDVISENGSKDLLLTLLGPNELVGRNIKYSSNLYSLFIKNFEMLRKEIQEIYIEMQYFETKKSILLPLQEFPDIIDDSQEEIVFDSAIEKTFSEQWTSNFPQWEITREPLIVENGLVMIPDFFLTYRNISFYLEIVGFWTERYLTKKVKKVTLLKKNYPNMILLVDKSLDWPETTVPTFFYDKKVPVLEIGQFLKAFEGKELEVLVKNLNYDQIKMKIDSKLKINQVLNKDFLFEAFNVAFGFELDKCMNSYFSFFKNKCSFVYFSSTNFGASTDFLFDMKKFLASSAINATLSIDKLKKQYSFVEEKILKIIIMYLGYDFKYRSLLEEELVFKKEKLIIAEIV